MSKAVQPLRSLSEIEAIKTELSKRPRDLLMFIIGINTTLRISDILPLKVRDVSGDYILLNERKTNKAKRIRINESVKNALHNLVPSDATPDDFLFPSRKGDKPISRVQAWRILDSAAKNAGLSHIRFGSHSLRKTAAYHAYNNGTDIALLMRVLNHSSEKETLRYIGIESEHIDNVYESLCL